MFKRISDCLPYRLRYLIFLFALILLAVGMINYLIVVNSQKNIIEHEALRIAEIATDQAIVSRTVYSNAVVDKLARDGFGAHQDYAMHHGTVPLPAQFFKLVGKEASASSGLYRYGPLSKWNLEPTQGLKDEFQQWAWKQLEKQDQEDPTQPIHWQPVWRFEKLNGVRTLRYMRADAASTMSCVHCHNAIERAPETIARRLSAGTPPGKQWKQHQLLGAIEANIPVDKIDSIAAAQAKSALAVGILISLCGFAMAAWLALRDVRREQQTAKHFEEKSKVDALTKLGNRTLFDERGKSVLAKAHAAGTQLGVLFVDIDRFKQINDTYGHHVGDRVLCEVGRRLTGCLRETDLIVRQGGDEFLILLESGAHRTNFEALARMLLDALDHPVDVDGMQLSISASIGISCFPQHGTTLAELIDKADAAMYRVKRNGRHAYHLWSEGADRSS